MDFGLWLPGCLTEEEETGTPGRGKETTVRVDVHMHQEREREREREREKWRSWATLQWRRIMARAMKMMKLPKSSPEIWLVIA